MKKFNKNSMAVKLSFMVLLIIILVASGAVKEIRENSYISFSKNTETHKSFMKDRMTLDIVNILSYVYDIGTVYKEIA